MTQSLATYVGRQGKPLATPETLRLEARDAVKLAKFFVALGFVAEKQIGEAGRRFIAAKANGVVLEIHPAREPQSSGEWNMTLIVHDAAAASARAVAAGGTMVSPLKEIPGGKKCVVASPEGQQVLLAEKSRVPVSPNIAAVRDVAVSADVRVEPGVSESPNVAVVATGPNRTPANPDAAPATVAMGVPTRTQEDHFSLVLDEVNEMKAGASDDQELVEVLERSGQESLSDIVPQEFSPKVVEQLRAIRTACGLMVVGWLVPVAITVLILLTQAGRKPEKEVLALNAVVALGGCLMLLVAKLICVGKRSEVCGSRWVMLALVLDFGTLLASLALAFLSPELPFVLIYLFCSLAAPIVFTFYLGRVAQGVQDKKLASCARIDFICLLAFVGVLVANIAVGANKSTSGSGIGDTIALALMGLLFATGIAGFLLHIALLVGFMSRSLSPPARVRV